METEILRDRQIFQIIFGLDFGGDDCESTLMGSLDLKLSPADGLMLANRDNAQT
jgi:hypothetical protein